MDQVDTSVDQPQEVEYDDLEYLPEGVFLLDGKPFTGLAVDRLPDGSRWSEVPFVNGREHGMARDWYRNGQLAGETPYVNGADRGVKRDWFEDGSLKSEAVVEGGYLTRKEVRNERQEVIELYERPESDPMYQTIMQWKARREAS